MPKSLIIGNQTFEFPLVGDNPDYGEEVTSWAEAVSDALSDVQAPNDILLTTSTILNNQAAFVNISAFTFSTASVRRIDCEYLIERSTLTPSQKIVEAGRIEGFYDGTNWSWAVQSVGDAGIEFNINTSGNVQYKSSDLSGTGYVGQIKFRAKTVSV